ncbi:MAG: hypothetical protein ACR2NG_08085 [Acidimicrobiia bacterium]
MTDRQPMIRRTILTTVLGLALAASACASDDADSQATSSTQPATTSSTTTVPPTTTTTTVAPTTTAAPVAEGDWVSISDGDSTILFVEPEGYIAIDLSAGDVEEIMGQLESEGEVPTSGELRALIDVALSGQTADFVYWAFDFASGTDEFVPNVNVLQLPAGPFDQIAVYQEVLPKQYAELGLEIISIEEIDTPAGDGLVVVTASPEGFVEYISVQLLVPTDDWVYTMTFSFEDEDSMDMDLAMKTFGSLTVE